MRSSCCSRAPKCARHARPRAPRSSRAPNPLCNPVRRRQAPRREKKEAKQHRGWLRRGRRASQRPRLRAAPEGAARWRNRLRPSAARSSRRQAWFYVNRWCATPNFARPRNTAQPRGCGPPCSWVMSTASIRAGQKRLVLIALADSAVDKHARACCGVFQRWRRCLCFRLRAHVTSALVLLSGDGQEPSTVTIRFPLRHCSKNATRFSERVWAKPPFRKKVPGSRSARSLIAQPLDRFRVSCRPMC